MGEEGRGGRGLVEVGPAEGDERGWREGRGVRDTKWGRERKSGLKELTNLHVSYLLQVYPMNVKSG